MAMNAKTILFVGGPLAGQVLNPVPRRLCCYRDATGKPIPTNKGDRVACWGRRPHGVEGVYARQSGRPDAYCWAAAKGDA
jgi:hypothetical protein